MQISSADITSITGQAKPDDAHACLWFRVLNGSSVFRCCDGYFKISPMNQNEKCIECLPGSYGFFCKSNCTCENGGTCNSVDGTCLCSEGYFGENCQYTCNCQNRAMCGHDGRCSCVDGFYGELCHEKCSCPENSNCNSETGECFCYDGFYGKTCLPCNCLNTERCDPFTGACSCKPGYHGENCDKQCSCFNGAYCSDDHWDLCKCSSGWIGTECTDCDTSIVTSNGRSFCEDKCSHCYNGHACSVEDGDCKCSPGWQGNRCNQICDEGYYGNNCSEACQCEHGICDHLIGICQCESRWTGKVCDKPCPNKCLVCKDDICKSCEPGWTDPQCKTKCKLGFYGGNCQERCTECHCSASCYHVNGSCPDVVRCEEQECKHQNARTCRENPFKLDCQDGWSGQLCNVTTSMTIDERHGTTQNPTGDESIANLSSLHIAIGIPVIVILSLSIVVVIIILIRQRRQQRSIFRKGNGQDHHSDNEKVIGIPRICEYSSMPCMSGESTPVAANINKPDSFITSGERNDQKQAPLPVYASGGKHQNETQQSNYEHFEPLIQRQANKSTSKDDDVTEARSCKGPYEIVSLSKHDDCDT